MSTSKMFNFEGPLLHVVLSFMVYFCGRDLKELFKSDGNVIAKADT